MTIHACAFVLGRHGLLVRGPSGAGKSLLVAECLHRAATAGLFARRVADDRVNLTTCGRALLAAPAPALAGRHELRFGGIVDAPYLPACRLDLVVDLVDHGQLERLPERETTTMEAGNGPTVTLPLWRVPQQSPCHACHIIKHVLPGL